MQVKINARKMEQNYVCKFCGTKFHRESTLSTHVCVKKRRYMDIDTTGSRLGFRSYQRFYELTSRSKKLKSVQEFIDSPYYIDFVKFGHHLANLKPLYPDQFSEFLIRNSIKLRDWTKDLVYYAYLVDIIRKEPATTAAERTISNILDWCEKNEAAFGEFFSNVSANEAAHMIKTGKISPWVIYLAASGGNLTGRLTDDHSSMINEMIDPGFWMQKFKKAPDDVKYIKSVLSEAGL